MPCFKNSDFYQNRPKIKSFLEKVPTFPEAGALCPQTSKGLRRFGAPRSDLQNSPRIRRFQAKILIKIPEIYSVCVADTFVNFEYYRNTVILPII